MKYLLIAETDAREIEWEYDTPRDAYRAWRQITATGRTHDTGCKVRRASLWRDGTMIYATLDADGDRILVLESIEPIEDGGA